MSISCAPGFIGGIARDIALALAVPYQPQSRRPILPHRPPDARKHQRRICREVSAAPRLARAGPAGGGISPVG